MYLYIIYGKDAKLTKPSSGIQSAMYLYIYILNFHNN